LVDHELLELAGKIPSAFKVRDGQGKWIFKEVYRPRLPVAVCDRPKQGFEIPVDAWLRGPLRDVFESVVLSPQSRIACMLDQATIRRMYRAHLNKTGKFGQQLWAVMVLGRWAEKYL